MFKAKTNFKVSERNESDNEGRRNVRSALARRLRHADRGGGARRIVESDRYGAAVRNEERRGIVLGDDDDTWATRVRFQGRRVTKSVYTRM